MALLIKSENMCFNIVGDRLVMFIVGMSPASDADMARAQDLTLGLDLSKTRCLVVTDGASMSKQSRDDAKLKKTNNIQTAVVSDSAAIRFFIAAFSLINKNIKAFAGADFRSSLAWLGASDDEKRGILLSLVEAAQNNKFVIASGVIPSLKKEVKS